MPEPDPKLTSDLKKRAQQLGFQLAGVTDAVSPLHLGEFKHWLSSGFAGEMHYLGNRSEAYEHPASVLEGVRSILMLGMTYPGGEPATPATPGTGLVRGATVSGRVTDAATGLPIDDFTRALQAEGAQLSAPRYPLLHQMPVFTHGLWKQITRLPDDGNLPEYDENDLPGTTAGNGTLVKLPSFPNEDQGLIEQYKAAFSKVFAHADELPRGEA